ncbi:sensor histidine kinase [Kordia sp.]|uniref:sensor histidine kinase n=1 Tax=Kordia sp. TaxID=1965332 RepID=UPI003D2CE8DF
MHSEIESNIVLFVIIGSLLLFLLVTFFIAFLALYRKKRRQHKHEQEKLATEFAATLLQSQLEIKEQTLQTIGRELHDNIGHTASIIKIYLNTINLKDETDSKDKIVESKVLLKQLIRDIKQLSLDLNSDRVIQIGLCNALSVDVDRLNKINSFHTKLAIIGDEFILPKTTITILYRMIQEIINNTIKHSKASEVILTLTFLENLLTLVIQDNGIGFTVTEKIGHGNGLSNLKNRANVIHAKFHIESIINKGTTTTIQIQKE